jgi:hypothetical protein
LSNWPFDKWHTVWSSHNNGRGDCLKRKITRHIMRDTFRGLTEGSKWWTVLCIVNSCSCIVHAVELCCPFMAAGESLMATVVQMDSYCSIWMFQFISQHTPTVCYPYLSAQSIPTSSQLNYTADFNDSNIICLVRVTVDQMIYRWFITFTAKHDTFMDQLSFMIDRSGHIIW